MKKYVSTILVLVLCVLLCACSSQSGQSASSDTAATTVSSSSASTVDKAELASLIRECVDTGAEELAKSYTVSTANEYVNAVSEASPLLNDEAATQEEVDAAVANIKAKKAALKERVQPVTITGSGDDVIEIPSELSACLVHAENYAGSNFAIWSDDSSMNHIDLLVNTIGNYSGTTTTAIGKGTAAFLEVTSSGDWLITLSPLYDARSIASGEEVSGSDIVYINPGNATKLTISNSGEHNFVVRGVQSDGSVALLVNDIGSYSGSVANKDYKMLIVESEGTWSVSW